MEGEGQESIYFREEKKKNSAKSMMTQKTTSQKN